MLELFLIPALLAFFFTGHVIIIDLIQYHRTGKGASSWLPLINTLAATYIAWYILVGGW